MNHSFLLQRKKTKPNQNPLNFQQKSPKTNGVFVNVKHSQIMDLYHSILAKWFH